MFFPIVRALVSAAELDIPVSSSAISTVSYELDELKLTITFKNSGKSYEYHGVPPHVYVGLMAAESKGAYFVENIRDEY